MKTVVCQNSELRVEDRTELKPGKGQVLLEVLRCGICGSDLHLRHHCNHMNEVIQRQGFTRFPSASDKVVFGHEFCGAVLDYGPGTKRKVKTGATVCAVPLLRNGKDIDLTGLSAHAPGAYAEQLLVQEDLMMAVPNGLDADHAALTEPMAVALHAVNRSEIKKSEVAIVIGCGPVGLAVIAMLKARGVRTVIASDFSATRRQLAEGCGADVVVNPAENSPYENWEQFGFLGTLPGALELAVGTTEQLRRLPLPWWQVWRMAENLGLGPKRPIIFECVGVPGVIQNILDGVPIMSRVMVVGVCMEADKIEPVVGINKEIDLRFCMGYTPLEYRDALHLLADGKANCEHLITGTVGLDGVANAFDALGSAEHHAKILIDPKLSGDGVRDAA